MVSCLPSDYKTIELFDYLTNLTVARQRRNFTGFAAADHILLWDDFMPLGVNRQADVCHHTA